MRDEKSLEQLQAEYFHLQGIVEEFDSRALTIKAWSVSVSAAALAAAYVESKPLLLLIALVTSVAFWIVESLWKVNQQAFYPRIKEIETAMRDGSFPIVPLQIAGAWSTAYHRSRRDWSVLGVMLWPHVALPHVPIAAAALALFFGLPPN